ncbi:gamma secretase complex protein [Chamberlinius hualienensis]
MTVMEFFGCGFIAFGPSIAMFTFTIAKDPVRIIMLIASAFFWLLSLLISSLLWFVVIPLKDQLIFGVMFSVLFQEVFRLFNYKLLRKAEIGLKKVTERDAAALTNHHILSYVSGLGFGLMSGAFSIINVLADSVGPGTVGLKGDSSLFFITSALTTMAFILMHTFWGVIVFNAMDDRQYWKVVIVLLSHWSVSALTLLNGQQMYAATLVPIYIIMMCLGIWAFSTAGGSRYSLKMCLKSCLTCKSTELVVDGR